MDDQYHIEHMTREEVNLAVLWAKNEGWNPGLYDAECFYNTDPKGFFAGKLNGKIIAVGSAVLYDKHFAFCGFYIVDSQYRDQGYGIALTNARLAYVGNRNVGIDGVLNMVDAYAKIGYRFAHNNARYSIDITQAKVNENSSIHELQSIPFTNLLDYDCQHFPAPRSQFLSLWIKQPESKALAYMENGILKGYGVIRKCYQGFKVGPLFANSPTIAEQLWQHLVIKAEGTTVFLDIPENNPFALEFVKKQGMQKVFATARMYMRGEPKLATEQIYGITTFELG
ncbi:GNAT family N-acetyltransferase [Legionella waltersii]|nr:GNAT family N-acetyltransferase [Legionella waltersii]